MANIASMSVQLNLLSKGFTRGLKRASASLRRFSFVTNIVKRSLSILSRSILRVGKFVLKWGLILKAFITGVFAVWIRRIMLSIDQLSKLADVIGIATEQFTAFRFGAEIAGASVKELDRALTIFGRRIGEAVRNTGEAVKGFEALGISADVLTRMGLGDALKIVSDRMRALTTPTQQAGVAFQLFGRQGVQILNFLKLGSKEIDRLVKEAQKLGIVFDRFEAAKVEAANDAIVRLQAVLRGVGQQIAIRISPILTGFINNLVDSAVAGESTASRVGRAFEFILDSIEAGLDKVQQFGAIMLAMKDAVSRALFVMSTVFSKAFQFVIEPLLTAFFLKMRKFIIEGTDALITFLKVSRLVPGIALFKGSRESIDATISALETLQSKLAPFEKAGPGMVGRAALAGIQDIIETGRESFAEIISKRLEELKGKQTLGQRFREIISQFEAAGGAAAAKIAEASRKQMEDTLAAPLAEEETPFEKAAKRAEGRWKKVTKEVEKTLGIFKQAKLFTIGFDLEAFPVDERDRFRFIPKEQKRRAGTDIMGRTKAEFEAEQREDAELRAVERTANASEQLVEQGGLNSGLALAG